MKSHIQYKNYHQIHRIFAMKLNTRSLFIATAAITGLVYAICFLFVAIAPQTTMAFFSYILHIDFTNIAQLMSWSSFIAGLLFWSLGTAVYAALIAWLYNFFLFKSRTKYM